MVIAMVIALGCGELRQHLVTSLLRRPSPKNRTLYISSVPKQVLHKRNKMPLVLL